MFTPTDSRKTLPRDGATAPGAALSMSLSLDELPDRPGARNPVPPEIRDLVAEPLLDWSDVFASRDMEPPLDDAPARDLTGEWHLSSEPLF